MDKQIGGLGELQRRCISVLIEQLIRTGRTNSINNLPLPASIVQQIEGLYQWKLDVSVILDLNGSFITSVPNTSPFFGHYRWTNENGVIQIDRRATASAQLDNFDPSKASTELIKFAFVLAATYSLEDHIRRLKPYYRGPAIFTRISSSVAYWSSELGILANPYVNTSHLRNMIHPGRRGSSDFWLAVIWSFWPIANQNMSEFDFRRWCNNVLLYAMELRHKSVVDRFWARHTEEMRKSLVNASSSVSSRFLNAAILGDEKEILFELLELFDNNDARRAAISYRIDEICTHFDIGRNSEVFEHLLDCMIADCSSIPANIARPLCKLLSILWDCVLMPEKRARISNNFVDLLRHAVEFGQVDLAKRIWNEEQNQFRKVDLLFREECAAFRSSCANGRLELVQLFWEWASVEQRCCMIRCKSGDALNTPARSGRLAIVRYLWENMDSRVAHEAIDSHGIDDISLGQMIITGLIFTFDRSPPREMASFLSMLISTPSDGRDPIYPPAMMKGILVAALTSGNGTALNILVRQTKVGGDDDRAMLHTLMGMFSDDQRLRLRSELTMEDDIKLCGLESVQMAIPSVLDQGTGDEDKESSDAIV